ncbi:MAG: glycosyltransferase family 4 protein [Odoribacteraceae bacterium]|jgi:glycosyltransferase involved in cell wall biosynthesis|nr:glycosyltransferase family 4 protein [Odoribacteraceae bacterium]
MNGLKKIKVAFFLGALERGGMETLLLDVLMMGDDAPFDMILLYREEGSISARFRETGARMFKVTPRGGLDVAFAWRLRRLLRRERVEVVHAQHPLEGAYALVATAATRVRVVMSMHGYDFHQSRKGARITAWALRHTRMNFFVSRALRRYYERKYRLSPDKQQVLYNGVRMDRVVPAGGREFDGTWRLGMVGSFQEGRDQLMVCRFLDLLRGAGVAFHFDFVGRCDTPAGEACVSFCREHGLEEYVSFLGAREDVPEFLAGLDAFVYATVHDSFGIAMVEAIAAGLPVFVNDWEVAREVTEEGALATIYRSGDADDLLRRFLHFTEHPDDYRRRAATAAARVRGKYDIRFHVGGLGLFYFRLFPGRISRAKRG